MNPFVLPVIDAIRPIVLDGDVPALGSKIATHLRLLSLSRSREWVRDGGVDQVIETIRVATEYAMLHDAVQVTSVDDVVFAVLEGLAERWDQ